MTRSTNPRLIRTATAARRAAVSVSGAGRTPGTRPPKRRLLRVTVLALAGLAAIAMPMLAGPSPAHAAAFDRFYANFAGEELMRAINLDRVALGIRPYARDATLEAIARDRAVACPSNSRLVIHGRVEDMAERGYFSHTIPGCTAADGTPFDTFDLLKRAGYSVVVRGEDISSNNYPFSAVSYAVGCSVTASACHGSTTLPWTVAVVERGFMGSVGHRANLLSTGYDRFGCAAWRSSGGSNLYSCYFTKGGNGTLDGTGPAIGGLTGVGAWYRTGSTVTFSASFNAGASVLSDGYVALDGHHVRNWAWDHVGAAAGTSVTIGSLKAGKHTLTWWARDASTNVNHVSLTFTVG